MPYLERVINCNLTRLGRMLRILRFHAHDLNLKPSWTAYMRWGKGPKQQALARLHHPNVVTVCRSALNASTSVPSADEAREHLLELGGHA